MLVEQVAGRVRIVVGNPFADGLPRRFNGLERLDVEGWVGGGRDVDDALPKSMEPEEEFDFAGAVELVDGMQGGRAVRTQEGIGTPDSEDEVAPKRAHRSGCDFWGRRDERWFRRGMFFRGGFGGCGGRAWHPAAFV